MALPAEPTPDFPFTRDYDWGPDNSLRTARLMARSASPATTDDGTTPRSGVVLDFGRYVVGRLEATLEAHFRAEFCVTYGETHREALRLKPYTSDWYQLPVDRWTVEPRQATPITSPGRRAFRYLGVWSTPHAPIHLDAFQITHQTYPVTEAGSFRCSHQRLNDIWNMAKETTGLCMQSFYEDGLKRDGMLWIGDYRIQFLSNTCPFGDYELARRSLLMMAASQRRDGALPACAARSGAHQHPHDIDYMPGIPFNGVDNWVILNYCADFPCAVYEYVLHSGDRQTLTQLGPCLRRLLAFLITPDAAGNPAPYLNPGAHSHFADNGINLQSHISLFSQLFLGFQRFMDLAAMLDDSELATGARLALIALRERFDELIDPMDHHLRDVVNEAHRGKPASWHAASMAALSGIYPAEKTASLLTQTTGNPESIPTANGYSEFFMLKSLFEARLTTAALTEILSYWGPMLEYELMTCPEFNRRSIADYELGEQIGGGAALSFCHGWSAGPAYLLPAYVLGIRPRTPGYGETFVAPQLGDLEWAEGSVPTPHGLIHVRWEQRNGRVTGELELPAGVTAVIPSATPGSLIEHRTRGPGRKRLTLL